MSLGGTGLVHIWSSSCGQGHMSQKKSKISIPQCKTSIGNNSYSVKHGAVKSVCTMWLSTTADRHLCHVTGSEDA